MVDMLQEVLRSGTGAGVWSYGLTLSCRGKDWHLARRLVRWFFIRPAYASSGWATTTIVTSILRGRNRLSRFGLNS